MSKGLIDRILNKLAKSDTPPYSVNVFTGSLFMNENQSVEWEDDGEWKSISLVFSGYNNGAVQNYQWQVYTVPRAMIEQHQGAGHTVIMAGSKTSPLATKYVYIRTTSVSGMLDNDDAAATVNGSTISNALYVLREVWLNY